MWSFLIKMKLEIILYVVIGIMIVSVIPMSIYGQEEENYNYTNGLVNIERNGTRIRQKIFLILNLAHFLC